MKRTRHLLWLILLLLPTIACGADFSYAHYASLLKQHVKTGVTINGIRLNGVDYEALSRDAKRSGSDYALLLKELAAFDSTTLQSREEKIAFWMNVYIIGFIKTIIDHYPPHLQPHPPEWLSGFEDICLLAQT